MAVAIRQDSSSVQRRSVWHLICDLAKWSFKSNSRVLLCHTCSKHKWFGLHNTGHCRKVQRACCQKVPPCPQTHSRAAKNVQPGWLSHPHNSTSPPMEHVSSHLSTSAPSSTSISSRMVLISLVSGTWTKSVIYYVKQLVGASYDFG